MLNHTYTQKPYYYTILKCSDYIYNFQKSHTRTIYIYVYNLDPKKEKKTRLWDKLCYKRTMIIKTKDDSIDLKYVQNLILFYKKPHYVFNNSIT